MKPFFSIITPSLQRQSLRECCVSLDQQTFENWQHVVYLDCSDSEIDWDFVSTLVSPRRFVYCCGQRFGHYGNRARHLAWQKATANYLMHCDDDNVFARPDALIDVAYALTLDNLP